jgi:hypothetical protein
LVQLIAAGRLSEMVDIRLDRNEANDYPSLSMVAHPPSRVRPGELSSPVN